MPFPHAAIVSDRLKTSRISKMPGDEGRQAFEDLARVAAQICQAPSALLCLFDAGGCRLEAKIGLEAAVPPAENDFCRLTMLEDELLIVADATADERFAVHSWVMGASQLRFFAGLPLIGAGGEAIGLLGVFDDVVRGLPPEQETALRALGRQAVKLFELHESLARLADINGELVVCRQTARQSEEYEQLFRHANDAILIFEPGCETVLEVNDKACIVYGRKRENFIGRSMKEMTRHTGRSAGELEVLLHDGVYEEFESVHLRGDGAAISLIINAAVIEYRGRKAILSINRDVTALNESRERYRQLFDRNPHPMWVYDIETLEILAVNEEAVLRYGFTRDEFLRMTIKELRPDEDIPQMIGRLEKNQVIEGASASVNRHQKKNGTIIDVEVVSQPIDFDGRSARLVLSTDITERNRAEEQLRFNALHDTLTGLPNRALFLEHLRHAIERNGNRGQKRFSVLFLDIDHFKVINDSLGHLEGDHLLLLIAQRLIGSLRPGDIVARLGGDEFTILLDDPGDAGDVTEIAERIQINLKIPFRINGREVFTSASIGITHNGPQYTKPENMLRDADIAMYRAKAKGKARHEIFDQTMHEQVNLRLQLETELRQALDRNEFCLYYQPIVDLQSDRIKGFEALVRWLHPVRGLVSPLEFIPIAEEIGLIVPLGQWILRESCRQLREWQNLHPPDACLTMSVNLSCRQFTQKDLVERVIETLEDARIEPETLRLEITESYLMEDSEASIAVMNRLRATGIRLSIDDFGTGYSSLSYLHRLPVSYLKIDRSFVSRMQDNIENREIVRTIVSLAKNLNLDVIAEGIETSEQAGYLKSLDCRYGQGFLYSKPVDAREAGELITRDFSSGLTGLETNKMFDLIDETMH